MVYNPDGTLASMTDAKGQKHVYTRDTYKRITSVTRFNAKGEPQPNDSYSYYRDTNPFDSAFSQNTQGRLAAVQWGSADSMPGLMTEMYSYTVSGQMTAKRLRVNRGGKQADLELHVSYDGEGRVASVTYPFGNPSLTYTYDSMGRLSGVSTASDAVVKDVAYDACGQPHLHEAARQERRAVPGPGIPVQRPQPGYAPDRRPGRSNDSQRPASLRRSGI